MSDLSEVLPGFLFLSGKRAAFDRELLKKSGITLIVNGESFPAWPRLVSTCDN